MHSLPVYIDGEKCGSISKRADGLMTVLSARCSARPGRIVRLYVFGGGKSALLGTMQPDGDCLVITRRFSRAELRKLPENIEYAADRAVGEQSTSDTLWRRGKMGCLVSDELIAIPAQPDRLGLVSNKLRSIEGRMYLIFERNL